MSSHKQLFRRVILIRPAKHWRRFLLKAKFQPPAAACSWRRLKKLKMAQAGACANGLQKDRARRAIPCGLQKMLSLAMWSSPAIFPWRRAFLIEMRMPWRPMDVRSRQTQSAWRSRHRISVRTRYNTMAMAIIQYAIAMISMPINMVLAMLGDWVMETEAP